MEKRRLRDANEILGLYISGYHEYVLDQPAHLSYASQNFCEMLGYTGSELVSDIADLYVTLVHPADCDRYRAFLESLADEEGTRCLEYRLVKSNGEVLHVMDTMTSKQMEDGRMAGFSTLTDITALKSENESLRFINDTIPCGLLRYTCEKTPKITYVNKKMIEMMRIPEENQGELDQLNLYKSNIYLMIAPESRDRFAQVLRSVFLKKTPHAGELSVVRGDGTKARLFGWITKYRNREGQEEFQSICMDVTERYQRKETEQTGNYLQALSGIYDMIFEFDKANRTVRYLHGNVPYLKDYLRDIPMQLDQATEKWLDVFVAKQDRKKMRRFLIDYVLKGKNNKYGPPQIRFGIRQNGEASGDYQAVLLQTGPSQCYFCCRKLSPDTAESALRMENSSLKSLNDEMQELFRRFTEGVVAFEVIGDRVKPLYVSDNAYAFFGYSKEAWSRLATESRTIREFVSGTGVEYAKFEELFEKGEAEFTYKDIKTGTERTIKAVCSEVGDKGDEPKYVMLYNSDSGKGEAYKKDKTSTRVKIRTFGYFDVFVEGRPVMFKTEKAKELLAILVDRRGGYVSSEEAISILWEDEPASAIVLARYRKVALRLKNLLEEYGISEIVESVNGKRRIVTELVDCDLYQYLSGEEAHAAPFNGSYLTNYSWGEVTLGELMNRRAGSGCS